MSGTLAFVVPTFYRQLYDLLALPLIMLLVSGAWFFGGYVDYKTGHERAAYFWAGIGVLILVLYSVGALFSGMRVGAALTAVGAALEIWHMKRWRRSVNPQ